MGSLMKRDMDLMRKILLRIEERSDVPPKTLSLYDFRDFHENIHVLSLHIDLMCDAGLVEVMDTAYDGEVKDFTITRLTSEGYEYLDAIRNYNVWQTVKKKIEMIGGATLDVIKQLAIKELSKELGI